MRTDFTQGDPRLILTEDGSRLQFTGGQPLMDHGLENMALISLFTRRGWCGNAFLKELIGSDFEEACNQPITKNSLLQIASAAKLALNNSTFGSVSVKVTNPSSSMIRVVISLTPPGSTVRDILLQRSSGNWLTQFNEPCYPNIKTPVTMFRGPGYGSSWGDDYGNDGSGSIPSSPTGYGSPWGDNYGN